MSKSTTATSRERTRTFQGLAFLAPNILGFMVFTFLPLIFSLVLAFSDWDLRIHNMFRDDPIRWTGFEHFTRLLNDPDFWKYLRNTLFLMMGIPFGIAGSLAAATMLSQDLSGGTRTSRTRLVLLSLAASAVLMLAMGILLLAGMNIGGLQLLLGGLACSILIGGTLGGITIYRTLFFLPHFTSGVATFLLWKKLYSPQTGPVNAALRPVLDSLGAAVNSIPAPLLTTLAVLCIISMGLLLFKGLGFFSRCWREGETGTLSVIPGVILSLLPLMFSFRWLGLPFGAIGLLLFALLGLGAFILPRLLKGREFTCNRNESMGTSILVGALLMVAGFMFLGLGNVLYALPEMAETGLTPPEWLTDYNWAKPAIMIMALWMAIGSNNMLLYLAGLTNIPGELYEAADIDGATGLQRFWNVTWPQLAPITFFIVIMSVIAGLQGGFEMARTMTQGGPAGATTTLSYYVYTEGFETGRLGYASAVAWTLFLMVLTATLFNWKFGSARTND
ncbi:MAG: sugar ABC transporter permease [Kiritimatiellia bacterium]